MIVPEVAPRAPSCDIPEGTPLVNFSREARPGHHLDSSLYSAPHLPGKSVSGPRFQGTHFTVEEEYKYLFPAEKLPLPETTFSMDYFAHKLSLELLRIIFVVLDLFILLYRSSHIFINAKKLCKGFEQTRTIHIKEKKNKEIQKLQEHLLHQTMNDRTLSSQSTEEREFSSLEYTVPGYSGQIDSQRSMLPKHPSYATASNSNTPSHTVDSRKTNHISVAEDDARKWTRRKWRGYLKCLHRLASSHVIPKILIGGVLFLLLYIVLQAVCVLFDPENVVDIGAFDVFLAGLQTQVNQTNWYLYEQAKHFNEVTMNIYKGQMQAELLNLEGLLEYFNAGKH